MTLPPGVNAQDFDSALKEFRQAVGADWVFTSDADVALYKDAYSPFWGEPEEKVASAAVAPESVEQVRQIVHTANRYKVPLYPISTGKNLGYGGSAPVLSGSVVLDLKRMNRILEVDERAGTCLVEPGVSYFDLYRHIQEKGYRLWVDTPDPGWGSVIGNAMDRGGGYTMALFRNHFDAHCGMEIVLPNGELMRTGMGAMPGAKTWQQYKSGFGPWIDGMFSQSNFGIVTKMGFWLMREPEAYLNGTVSVPRHADLVPLVDILTRLEDDGIVNGMSHLGSPLLGNNLLPAEFLRSKVAPEVGALLAQPGGPTPAQLDAYGRKNGVPVWAGLLQFYGPELIVRAQWEHAKEKFRAIPGATFTEGDFYKLPLSAAQQEKVHKVSFGIPNLSIFFIGARSGVNTVPGNGHIWFSPIIPRSGEAVFEAQRVFTEAAQELGLPANPLAMATTYWQRAFIFLFGFPITRDVKVNQRNREAFRALVRIAAEHGWGEYRTAPAYQDAVMDTYSFNNHALLRFHETLKDAIDPNGILSAGRYGIWPKHLRGKKS